MTDPTSNLYVPVLLGPTAAGKTALATDIAAHHRWEIVSCDSRQIYRGMNIGTAKPENGIRNLVPHHLVDCIEPSASYSAFDFTRDAGAVIRNCADRRRVAFVCGGTGLYFERFRRGIAPLTASDPVERARLQDRVRKEGCEPLFQELRRIDPEAAAVIHPHDAQRIIRALLVYQATGTPISVLRRHTPPPNPFTFRVAVIVPPRDILYKRINRRVEEMVSRGLYEEFLSLCRQGFDEHSPGLQCIGYRELFSVRNGTGHLADAIEEIKKNTRNYAKRQCAWFRAHNREEIVPWNDDDGTLKSWILERIDPAGDLQRE